MTGTQAHLESDRAPNRGPPPRPYAFRVTAAGFGERAALSFDDREVVLTLSSAAADGEWLTVRYLPPDLGAGLWDAEGNRVAAVSDAGEDAT